MTKSLFIAFLLMCCGAAQAQSNDSLFAVHKGPSWSIRYTVKPGESIKMLAFRFFITDGQLVAANDEETIKKFAPGSMITIPVPPENFTVNKETFGHQHDLYYRVGQKDDIGLISTYSGVSKSQIRTWNNLHGNTVHPDDVLFVGWVKMVIKDTSNPATDLAYPIFRKKATADTGKIKVPGALDSVYNVQTNNGSNVLTEKGTAVFFEKAGKNNVYYAFHNATQRGAIIKVVNPGTGKTIYVKVLGPIPDTKLYANAIIGICSAAKEALGVTDTKTWCELSYSPN